MKQLDFSPLYTPMSESEVQWFRHYYQSVNVERKSKGVFGQALGIVYMTIVMSVFTGGFFVIPESAMSANLKLILAPMVIFIYISFIALIRRHIRVLFDSGRATGERYMLAALSKFAGLNQLDFMPYVENPDNSGVIFQEEWSRDKISRNVLSGTLGGKLNFQMGWYENEVTLDHATRYWRYLRIDMNRNLPHIILDSTVDNVNILGKVFNNLPDDIDPNQRLSLEGGFNDYFTLYAPKDYERDALYIFTPDLMALLIDGATWCDVEIVDSQIYFYSAYNKFDYVKEMEFVWKAFRIMSIMGAKLYNQTDYYNDERIGNWQLNIVADQGKRLKNYMPLISTIVFVLSAVFLVIYAVVVTIAPIIMR